MTHVNLRRGMGTKFLVEFELVHSGDPDFEIASALGPKTRKVLASVSKAVPFIIRKKSFENLNSAKILATGPSLNKEQVDLIVAVSNEPRAYYCGDPIFQRFPPEQDFAIQMTSDCGTLDLMVDLQNPSWGFYCESESYQQWNWVGHIFKQIAKESFPEFASPSKSHLWRKGAIAALQREAERNCSR